MRLLVATTVALAIGCSYLHRAPPAAVEATAPPPPPKEFAVVAVAAAPGPTPDLVELTNQLRAVLAERDAGVMQSAALRERMVGPSPNASFAELDRAYSGAVQRCVNGDYQGAIKTLTGVIADLERLPDGQDTFGLWTKAMLRLARSYGSVGEVGEEERVLTKLVTAAPQVRVDLAQYPPSFAKRVDEVRAKVAHASVRKLTVTAPMRVKVYVNGREFGLTPVVAMLPEGRYRVSAIAGQTRVYPVLTDLTTEDQTVALDIALIQSLRPWSGPGFAFAEQDRTKRLITAGAYLRVERLLATSFVSQGDVTYLAGTVYDVPRGMLLREGLVRLGSSRTMPAGGLAALADFILKGERSDLVQQETAAAPAGTGAAPPAASAAPPSAPGAAPAKAPAAAPKTP